MQALLTLTETAKRYRCSARTFSKYVREYQIPYRKLGKAKLFDIAEVDLCLRTTEALPTGDLRRTVTPFRPIEKKTKYDIALGL